MESYVPVDDKAYFTAKYLADTPNWPSKCAGEDCLKPNFGSDYKVTMRNPVHCCLNAKNCLHECKQAYCQSCFAKLLAKAQEEKASRPDGQNGSARKKRRSRKAQDLD